MSTRATYTIKDDEQTHHFYIHHDGYTEGAAGYFYNLFTAENKRGGLAEQFLRGNDNAEFTINPERHADTEFHYTLNHKGELEQIEYKWDDEGERTGITAFKGNVWDFVNQFGQFEDGDSPLTYIKYDHYVDVFSIGSIFKSLLSKVAYIQQHTTMTGNCSSNIGELFKGAQLIITTYDELATQHQCEELLTRARMVSDLSDHLKSSYELYGKFIGHEELRARALETIKSTANMINEVIAA
jgi:hypothetical protein